jgi:hypothetical protein
MAAVDGNIRFCDEIRPPETGKRVLWHRLMTESLLTG